MRCRGRVASPKGAVLDLVTSDPNSRSRLATYLHVFVTLLYEYSIFSTVDKEEVVWTVRPDDRVG